MGDIIWVGRFKDKRVVNPNVEILDQSQYWKNVVCLPTQLNLEQTAIKEIQEQEEKVIAAIDYIIDLWIKDYTNYSKEKWINHSERNLLEETTKIWEEMLLKAETIEETIDFIIENDLDMEVEDWYVLDAIENILIDYRDRVFEKLVRNEKRFKNNN